MHAYLIVSDSEKTRDDILQKQLQSCGINPHDVVFPTHEGASIGIESVHNFIARLGLSPVHGDHTAGVIADADLLTPVAMQALLKTLEEPPGAAYLFLGTANAAGLPSTIVSRCRIISAHPDIPAEQDAETLRFIEDLAASTPGKQLDLLDTLGTDRNAIAAWLDQAIRVLGSQVTAVPLDTDGILASKRRILRGFIEAKRYIPNNVNIRLLIEHALFAK